MTQERRQRHEIFFLGIVLAMSVGVPLSIFSVYFFADNITQLVTATLVTLLVFGTTFGIIIIFRKRIFKKFFGTAKASVEDVTATAINAIKNYSDGNKELAFEDTQKTLKTLGAYLGWIQFRRWVVAVMIGLIVGFGTLIGSALIQKQNALIEIQNDRILEANEKNFEFIDAQADLFKRQRKIENLAILSDSTKNPNLREEAFLEYIKTEFDGLSANETSADEFRLKIPNLQLSDIRIKDLDLRKIQFLNCNFTRSVFTNCDISNSSFDECNLKYIEFNDSCNLLETYFERCILTKAEFQYANLTNAGFYACDMPNLRFFDCNLRKIKIESCDFEFLNISLYDNIDHFNWRYFWERVVPELNTGRYTIYPQEIMDSIVTVEYAIALKGNENVHEGLYPRDIYFGPNGEITTGQYSMQAFSSSANPPRAKIE